MIELLSCGRCTVAIDEGEPCWYCEAPLCVDCWEAAGDCGHPEAGDGNELGAGEQVIPLPYSTA